MTIILITTGLESEITVKTNFLTLSSYHWSIGCFQTILILDGNFLNFLVILSLILVLKGETLSLVLTCFSGKNLFIYFYFIFI